MRIESQKFIHGIAGQGCLMYTGKQVKIYIFDFLDGLKQHQRLLVSNKRS